MKYLVETVIKEQDDYDFDSDIADLYRYLSLIK